MDLKPLLTAMLKDGCNGQQQYDDHQGLAHRVCLGSKINISVWWADRR